MKVFFGKLKKIDEDISGNRNWMYCRRVNEDGSLNEEFTGGVEIFLNFAYSELGIRNGDKIKCPCTKCVNGRFLARDDVAVHLYRWGFVKQYYVWIAHIEKPQSFESNQPQPQPQGESSSPDESVDPYRDMLEDVFREHFDENNNLEIPEEPNREAKEFYELLKKTDVETFEGSGENVMGWIARFLHHKIKNNVTDTGADDFLSDCRRLVRLEDRQKLPESMYKLKRLMKGLRLGYKTYDVCVNNCFLYYKDAENYTECPVCGEARYENWSKSTGKGLSRKKLWYFPIAPRLQRLYMSRKTAEQMTWHLNCNKETDKMIHPACSEAWKHFDATYPEFAAEPRNVRLGLSTDGFSPHNDSSNPYSCWPVFVTPYNLPPDLCMRQEYIFLSLIISGPKSPGKNIDVLLRPLIDDLKMLWSHGVETYDSFKKQNFKMKTIKVDN